MLGNSTSTPSHFALASISEPPYQRGTRNFLELGRRLLIRAGPNPQLEARDPLEGRGSQLRRRCRSTRDLEGGVGCDILREWQEVGDGPTSRRRSQAGGAATTSATRVCMSESEAWYLACWCVREGVGYAEWLGSSGREYGGRSAGCSGWLCRQWMSRPCWAHQYDEDAFVCKSPKCSRRTEDVKGVEHKAGLDGLSIGA